MKLRDGALLPGAGQQLHLFQIGIINGQLRRLRLRAKGPGQLCAEEATQLLLHQRLFLFLRRERQQKDQPHPGEGRYAHKQHIVLHKGRDTPGDDQKGPQQYADALPPLVPAKGIGQLLIGHFFFSYGFRVLLHAFSLLPIGSSAQIAPGRRRNIRLRHRGEDHSVL